MTAQSSIKSFLIKLRNEFRTCHHCGSVCTKHVLCSSCWQNLPRQNESLFQNRIRSESLNLSVLSLMNWIPDESRRLSKLIGALKGGSSTEDFEKLAIDFHLRRLSLGRISEEILFVPAPSKTGEFDHALSWATALAGAFSGAVAPCLRPTSGNQQKLLKRADRSLVQLESSENFSQSTARIVFVDDVVTSGSTARAAYIALGRPQCFEVWSIAYRHLAAHKRL
jgi:predicted amidophosphoribosyltransferase